MIIDSNNTATKISSYGNHGDMTRNYTYDDKYFYYRENIKYIENSFIYDINNGVIEGNNNLIKCIKRIAFGYRKYDHFIARIFLIKNNIKG